MPQTNCRIDTELYIRLREYREKTGLPIAVAIERAVKEWLEKQSATA